MADFDTKCNECNKSVSADFSNSVLYVDICPSCKEGYEEDAHQKGHQMGFEVGMEEAKDNYDQEFLNYLEIRDTLTS